MKHVYFLAGMALTALSYAQGIFPSMLEVPKLSATMPTTVTVPLSPIKSQVLFVGGVDTVAHTAIASKMVNGSTIYGEPAGTSLAKEWHDFLGFSPATEAEKEAMAKVGHTEFLGWISCNHEMVWHDNKIGDGGGMTVFGVKKDAATDTLIIIKQDLSLQGFPAGQHKFFNVDFANTVGETGMNCGGISSIVDGRIWTAEEWFRTSNKTANDAQNIVGAVSYPTLPAGTSPASLGVRDTADFTITTGDFKNSDFQGKTLKKYQNFNWMVEIDPRKAKAIRKQYNWGRQGFEGGTVSSDNTTIYLGDDNSPGLFTKFVASTPGDFTSGKTYVYKYDEDNDPQNNWIEMVNDKLDSCLNLLPLAWKKGATPFCRVEWVTLDKSTGKIYFSETGNDNWAPTVAKASSVSKIMIDFFKSRNAELPLASQKDLRNLSDAQIADSLVAGTYKLNDYYGRVTEYDPATGKIRTLIEGGPFFVTSPTASSYPEKHLTQPDGLNTMYIDGKSYLIINEDLNGRTFGRVPSEINSTLCELFILDLSIANPTVNDLFKVAHTPKDAEVTGGFALDDNTVLFNVQHPNSSNPFPHNHSHTVALSGFKQAILSADEVKFENKLAFEIYPNPTSRELHLNKVSDVAIYNLAGKRVLVERNKKHVDISMLPSGSYFVMDAEKNVVKLIIE